MGQFCPRCTIFGPLYVVVANITIIILLSKENNYGSIVGTIGFLSTPWCKFDTPNRFQLAETPVPDKRKKSQTKSSTNVDEQTTNSIIQRAEETGDLHQN